MKERIDDFLSWPNLAKIGNLQIMKFALLAPFVAQVVVNADKHQSLYNFITLVVSYDKLLWLYWSLVFLGFGQAWFTLRCPEDVAKYPLYHEYRNMRSTMSTVSDHFASKDYQREAWLYPISRVCVAVCYSVGLSYFCYVVPKTIFEMIKRTVGLFF